MVIFVILCNKMIIVDVIFCGTLLVVAVYYTHILYVFINYISIIQHKHQTANFEMNGMEVGWGTNYLRYLEDSSFFEKYLSFLQYA